jgi:SWI/SNF-related matrix-associated actin-dependent regulator 1 of chromatin subfamily A
MSFDSLQSLKNWGFQLCPILDKYWRIKQRALGDNILTQDEACFLKDIEGTNGTIHDISAQEIEDIPGLKGVLMPFQKQGVAFIERKKGRAILADEMGLGKTVQALAWLQLHPELRPAIVVCPAVAKGVWKTHVQKWMSGPGKIQVVYGSRPEPLTGDVVIINYDILPNDYQKEEGTTAKKEVPRTGWVDFLIDLAPKVVIADEVHYIKSSKANRTKGVKKLVKKTPHFIAISGTPVVNRPMEAYNVIQLVKPSMFPEFLKYGIRYCGGKRGVFGWDFSGATHTDELHDRLMEIMIRRTKKEVLKDLPDKTFSFIPLQMTNRAEYDRASTELIAWIAENFGVRQANKARNAEALVKFNYLRQLTSKGKIDSVLEWIHDFLDTDGKLVVFGTYKMTLDRIMEEFGDLAVRIDGDTPTSKRSEIEQRFQNDPNVRLFVGNTQAAGVALTLTASSSVAFVELPWSPGDLSQASDRCHRIGQKNAVNIYYLLAEGTMDEDMASILDEKRLVLDAVLDGKETPDEDSPTITELINKFRKGEN